MKDLTKESPARQSFDAETPQSTDGDQSQNRFPSPAALMPNPPGPSSVMAEVVTGDDQLIALMWRSQDLCHQAGVMNRREKRFKNTPVKTAVEAVTNARSLSSRGDDCYFACAEYRDTNSRKADNAVGACAFWLDIDCGPDKAAAGKGYANVDAAIEALQAFCKTTGLPQPTHIVNSGSGLHIYWVLDGFVEKAVWQAYATKLKAISNAGGVLADPSRTADIASVLRIPGTLNHKYTPPKPVVLITASSGCHASTAMQKAIDDAHSRLCNVTIKAIVTSPVTTSPNVTMRPQQTGTKTSLKVLQRLLDAIDPDCGYEVWIRCLMAMFHETLGSDDGLAMSICWSSKGSKFKGKKDIENRWRSFDINCPNPVRVGSLIYFARQAGANVEDILNAGERFECCETASAPMVAPTYLTMPYLRSQNLKARPATTTPVYPHAIDAGCSNTGRAA